MHVVHDCLFAGVVESPQLTTLPPNTEATIRSEEERAYLKCCCADLREQLHAALKREDALRKELEELKEKKS